ncbi:hypothetical protein C8F01DRAFT_1158790 [Mycena amicta]|nr:hypothetical protein C8F01DRAFT_1158790 [Mycena amicta]
MRAPFANAPHHTRLTGKVGCKSGRLVAAVMVLLVALDLSAVRATRHLCVLHASSSSPRSALSAHFIPSTRSMPPQAARTQHNMSSKSMPSRPSLKTLPPSAQDSHYLNALVNPMPAVSRPLPHQPPIKPTSLKHKTHPSPTQLSCSSDQQTQDDTSQSRPWTAFDNIRRNLYRPLYVSIEFLPQSSLLMTITRSTRRRTRSTTRLGGESSVGQYCRGWRR